MIFEIERKLSESPASEVLVDDIPVLDANAITYDTFFHDFMIKNVPCIIKGVAKDWQASKYWVQNGKLCYDYLAEKYGHLTVTVYNCLERYYNSQKPSQMEFNGYLSYLKDSANEVSRLDYLKNWHLALNDELDRFYEVPIFFASDWLNEYYINYAKDNERDDYRFVYIGPKNSWTPFHVDVFTSYSWSVNVTGRKRWLLFPPGEEECLRDQLGNLPYDVTELENLGKHYDLVQEQNEAIFVPSGWHHQVWNMENTISINHNWVNGCNLKSMYEAMMSDFRSVKKEIADCKDMVNFNEQCQLLLKVTFGMDFHLFYDFLKSISLCRIEMLEARGSHKLFHDHEIGTNHILFDLIAVKCVLEQFVKCDEIDSLETFRIIDLKPSELLEKVVNIISQ